MIEVFNIISNTMVVLGASFFLIGIFGRRSKTMNELTVWERVFIKVALAFTASGSLLNLLTELTPHPNEVFLNFAIGLLFVWAAWFHWKYFVKKGGESDTDQ